MKTISPYETQLEKLKHELDAIGVTYHETSRYGKYGVAKRVVIWKGADGRINEAVQVAHARHHARLNLRRHERRGSHSGNDGR